ncbi:MAG: LysR family transcriptional regulator [Sarcina sp.]
MNFEQLKIIITLGEEKSFSKTANRLNMTTSAISQAVSALEKELGIVLFNRSRSGSFTTEKGQYLVREAVQILAIKDEIFRYSSDKENKKLKIKIGVIPCVNVPLIRALKKLKESYEFLEISIEQHNTEKILKGLNQKKYNFAIISFSDTIKTQNINYRVHRLLQGEFCFIAHKDSRIGMLKEVSFEDIIKENMAVYDDKFLKNYISYIEGRTREKANIFLNSNDVKFILDSVEENIAIAPLLRYFMESSFKLVSNKIKLINISKIDEFIKPSLWFLEGNDFIGQEFSKDFFSILKAEL